jgi:hypothetical protein
VNSESKYAHSRNKKIRKSKTVGLTHINNAITNCILGSYQDEHIVLLFYFIPALNSKEWKTKIKL